MKIILFALIFMALLLACRLIIGPTLWDRLLALNLISSKLIMILVIFAVVSGSELYLDIAILYVTLGFIGIAFMAIFIQKKGRT